MKEKVLSSYPMKHMATETATAGNESAILYRLLVSPEFRWIRYLILVMVLGTISFNQVFIIFMDYRDILGDGFMCSLLYTYLCGCYLPESFLVILKIFVEKGIIWCIYHYCLWQ